MKNLHKQTADIDERIPYYSSPVSSLSPQFSANSLLRASYQSPSPTSDLGRAPKPWAPVILPSLIEIESQKLLHSSKQLDSNQITSEIHQSPLSIFKSPPSFITLRNEPPITQPSTRIYQAEPAANLAAVSGNMRGDTKWPPESVRQQTDAENRAKLELAKGPTFRPRRVAKDYSRFFAQHALTSSYPGYRAPPGTQYFVYTPAGGERFEA